MKSPRRQFPTAMQVLIFCASLAAFWYLFYPTSRSQAAMLGGMLATLLWSWMTSQFTLNKIGAERLHAPRVFQGDAVPVSLRLRNPSWPPLQMLEVEDRFTASVELERRHLVPLLQPGWEVMLHGRRTADRHRGLYLLGPLRLACADPLGVFFRTARADAITRLTVYPRPEALPEYVVPGPLAGPGASLDVRPRAGQGDEILGVREYVHGDPAQRVHWRTTARRGKLHVKRLNSAIEAELRVLADFSRRSRFGTGAEATSEITAAAALAVLSRGFEARHRLSFSHLNRGEWHAFPAARGMAHLHMILDRLAVVAPLGEGEFWTLAAPDALALRAGSRAMFIVSAFNTPLAEALPLVRRLVAQGVAVDVALIDIKRFVKIFKDQEGSLRAAPPPFEAVAESLRMAGARVFALGREATRLDVQNAMTA